MPHKIVYFMVGEGAKSFKLKQMVQKITCLKLKEKHGVYYQHLEKAIGKQSQGW
jgi:hypothetical protein